MGLSVHGVGLVQGGGESDAADVFDRAERHLVTFEAPRSELLDAKAVDDALLAQEESEHAQGGRSALWRDRHGHHLPKEYGILNGPASEIRLRVVVVQDRAGQDAGLAVNVVEALLNMVLK